MRPGAVYGASLKVQHDGLHPDHQGKLMKFIASAAAVLYFSVAAATTQTLDDLKNDGKNTDNILTYGMGYQLHRYSPLKEINKTTVKRLVPVWNLSLDNQWGEQAQPLVKDGVMYVTNARATVAIDVATGRQIWKTPVEWLPETPRIVCCGVSNKGAAIYQGRIYRTTLDAHVVALDAKTGAEIWKSKAAEWKEGYSMTVAPLIAIDGDAVVTETLECAVEGFESAAPFGLISAAGVEPPAATGGTGVGRPPGPGFCARAAWSGPFRKLIG